MKLYIFLTANIHPIGGIQSYVAGKAAYLEEHGWTVKLFFSGTARGRCAIPFLERYLEGGLPELEFPPEEWSRGIRNSTFNKIRNIIGCDIEQAECIDIESQNDVTALWGEPLARMLQAKHVCFLCCEVFRGARKYYAQYLEFFDFKHKRRELTCIHEDSMEKLFDGYKEVSQQERYVFFAGTIEIVQDIEDIRVEELEQYDWNICCIGRAEKTCVPGIIDGIGRFARKHSEKKIQIIMVGELGRKREVLDQKLKLTENIHITEMGDMVPIPRQLFDKTDVVIARAGCAECAVEENVPTIVVDVNNGMANGILGYTTFNSLFIEEGNEQSEIDMALEQVLVDKIQVNMELHWTKQISAPYYYEEQLNFLEKTEKQKEYYSISYEKVKVNWNRVFKYTIRKKLPILFLLYDKFKMLRK